MTSRTKKRLLNGKIRKIAFSKREQAITCLAILLSQNGYAVSASELRKGRNINLCQFNELDKIASEHGFTLGKITVDHFRQELENGEILIARVDGEGTVLLSEEKRYCVIDNPYAGMKKKEVKDLQGKIQGDFLLKIDDTMRDFPKRDKPEMLIELLKTEKSLLILAATIVLLSILHGVVGLIDPIVKNVYFTNVIQLGIIDWAKTLAIAYFLVAAIGGFILVGGGALSLLLTCRLSLMWAYKSFTSVLRVPNNYLDLRSKGDLMNRIRSSERLGSFVGSDEIRLIGSIFNLVILIFVLISTSIPLAVLMILFQVGATYFVIATNQGWKTRADDLQQRSAQEAGSFVNIFSQWENIRVNKALDTSFRIHQLVVNRRIRAQQRMSIYSILVQFGSNSIDTIQSVALLTFAAILIMQGEITLGEYIAFQAILSSVLAPIKSLSKFLSKLQSVRATHERILDVVEEASLQIRNGLKKAPEGILLKISSNENEGDGECAEQGQKYEIEVQEDGRPRELQLNSESDINALEAILSGDCILKDSSNVEISYTDGVRNLLVARQDPHIYDVTIEDNIRLGLSSSELKQGSSARDLTNYFNWGQGKLHMQAMNAGLTQDDLYLIGILRTLWRKPKAIALSECTTREGIDGIQLIENILEFAKAEKIQVLYMTTRPGEIQDNTLIRMQASNIRPLLIDAEGYGGNEE